MQKISPFLWFDNQAEEAMEFYLSIFPKSRKLKVVRYPEGSMGPAGSVMTCSFELEGSEFTALNGGPHYKINPAISFTIMCDSQQEIDHYWDQLLAGGKAQQCGWLTDRFGVTWQVVPKAMIALFEGKDPAKSARVNAAMMKMIKLDIGELERAAAG